MNDEENTMQVEAQTENAVPQEQPDEPVKKRGPGRPRKAADATSAPRRRGRPPKSGSATTRRRGRPPKAMSLMMELEREIEGRFQTRLAKAEAQVEALKAELKAAQKRERDAIKLFERQEKALTKFISTWNTKELTKVQKAAEPKKRRGRPRKNA